MSGISEKSGKKEQKGLVVMDSLVLDTDIFIDLITFKVPY